MRIDALRLIAFGAFSNQPPLDLSAGREGVHLIVGCNEAGKSTALRAIRAALFGIDVQTSDNFLHHYDKLRIGLTLRLQNGSSLAFVRRKQKPLLRDENDRTPLDDDALAPYLGDLAYNMKESKDRFMQLHGIDHDQLVAGGKLMAQGKGHLRDSLFAAASGLTSIDVARRSLESELNLLFTKSGRGESEIKTELDRLREAMQKMRTESLSHEDWKRWDEQLRADETAKLKRQAEADVYRAVHRRLERIQQAIEPIAQRELELKALLEVAEARELPGDFGARLARANATLSNQRPLLNSAQAALLELEGKIEELERKQPTVSQGLDFLALRLALENARAAGDLEKRNKRTRESLADVERDLWAEAGAIGLSTVSLDAIEALPAPTDAVIGKFQTELAAINRDDEDLRKTLEELPKKRDKLKLELGSLRADREIPSDAELESSRRNRDQYRRALVAAWQAAEPFDEATAADLEAAVKRADEISDRLRFEADRIAKYASLIEAQSELDKAETDLAARIHATADRRSKKLEAWVARWKSLPVVVDEPAEMRDWRAKYSGLARSVRSFLKERVELERQTDRAEKLRAELITTLGARNDLASESLELLVARAEGFIQSFDEFNALNEDRRAEQKRVRDAQVAIEEAEGELKALRTLAGTDSNDELPNAERNSRLKRDRKREIKHLEDIIAGYAAGTPLDQFIPEVAEFDADALPARIECAAADAQKLQEDLNVINQRIGESRAWLRQHEAVTGAVDWAQEAENRRAAVKNLAYNYTRLSLSLVVLNRAVETYLGENQTPVLRKASEYISILTSGRFQSLAIDLDEKRNQVLQAVKPNGEHVGVEGLSDGTKDQLFLALRLAYIDHRNRNSEPMPLIVDDILIRFDDNRAAATFRVLAELSRRTQVIVFTHHHHMINIAGGGAPDDLYVHHLDAAASEALVPPWS